MTINKITNYAESIPMEQNRLITQKRKTDISGGNVKGLSSGVYFYQLVAGDYIAVKRFILMK